MGINPLDKSSLNIEVKNIPPKKEGEVSKSAADTYFSRSIQWIKSLTNSPLNLIFNRAIAHPSPLPLTENLSPPLDQTNYIDENRLLKGKAGDQPIEVVHREWSLGQAILMEQMHLAKDLETINQLQLVLLHNYSKAATINESQAKELGIQTTPFMPEDERYHRSTSNELLDKVYSIYAKDLKVSSHEIFLIDSPLITKVFARENAYSKLNITIDSKAAFERLMDDLLHQAENDHFPGDRVLIDFSKYMGAESIEPKDMKQKIIQEFEDIVIEKVKKFLVDHPAVQPDKISTHLLAKLNLIAFTEHKDQSILLLPEFLTTPRFDQEGNVFIDPNRHGALWRHCDHLLRRSGFRISPDQAKEAWLKLQDVKTILQNSGIPIAELATRGEHIPIVSSSFHELMQMPIIKKFKSLSEDLNNPPYLKVLPEATYRLLDGLDQYRTEQGESIQAVFKRKGIENVLQTSYFRMLNGMNEAILKKNDLIAFNNQIELIHQEIQGILAIVTPYDDQAFAQAIVAKLTHKDNPVVPLDLDSPQVHLKASAIHSLSSIMASVEAQKGTNQLNVAVLKDSYYESSEALGYAKAHHLQVLDGDLFNQEGIRKAFKNPPQQPFDLFVCEFHHNISTTRQSYQLENLAGQVKEMVANGLAADPLTVAIDTTMDLENSPDLRTFLADEKIHSLIKQGQLNIVFFRSAQKFDMLGIDNYYGGITMAINRHESFSEFNQEMNRKEDQLRGLSYQGLTHLQRYAGTSLDNYRQGIMENTRKLYHKLPKEMIYHEGSTNPIQISQIDDKEGQFIFLDIKFSKHTYAAEAFRERLKSFAKEERLPFTTRASFGFVTTNFTVIDGKKFRLNPGLDSEQTLDRYAAFFKAIQDSLEEGMKPDNISNLSPAEVDRMLAARIYNVKVL